jgi:hypothetical protein
MQFKRSKPNTVADTASPSDDQQKPPDAIWPAAVLTFAVLFTFTWIGLLAWITVWFLA